MSSNFPKLLNHLQQISEKVRMLSKEAAEEVLAEQTSERLQMLSKQTQSLSEQAQLLSEESSEYLFNIQMLAEHIAEEAAEEVLAEQTSERLQMLAERIQSLSNQIQALHEESSEYLFKTQMLAEQTDEEATEQVLVEHPTELEIEIEIPEDTPPERIRDLVRQAALQADSVHRSNGGHGLKIDTVDVFSDSRVPEGANK